MPPRNPQPEDLKRASARSAAKKVDYVQLSNGKLDGYFDDYEEDNKPARARSRSKKPKASRGDDEWTTKKATAKKYGKVRSVSRPQKIPKKLMPDNQLSLLLKWREEKKITKPAVNSEQRHKEFTVKNIMKSDLSKMGTNLQAIFVNATWKTKSRREKDGQSISEFSELRIPPSMVKNGIVFVWSEKEILGELIDSMEEKGFTYIECFQIIFISSQRCLSYLSTASATNNSVKEDVDSEKSSASTLPTANDLQCTTQDSSGGSGSEDGSSHVTAKGKKKGAAAAATSNIKKIFENTTSEMDGGDATKKSDEQIVQEKEYLLSNLNNLKAANINSLLLQNDYPYFKKTKHTILMFRRITDKNIPLELRHQRTSDVVFELTDEHDPSKVDQMMKEYVYQMIETLLPKAHYTPGVDKQFKMMELFANPNHLRPGWISVVEK